MAADDQPVCPMLLATRRFPKRTKRERGVRFSRLDVRLCEDAMRRTEARRNVPAFSFVQTLQSKEIIKWTRHPPLRFLRTLFSARLELSRNSWLLAIQFP